ncbi:unnamed protein product [Mytilus edulis]|uniref:Uncharacterized protein n=1 Tax=Mytilus edulis TaxID=6550 RepID=A0A8S3RW99_MYTED|nr:unnamed protein product [Mytilus edulis]
MDHTTRITVHSDSRYSYNEEGTTDKRPGNCHGIALIDDQIAVGGYGKIYIISKTGDLKKTLDVENYAVNYNRLKGKVEIRFVTPKHTQNHYTLFAKFSIGMKFFTSQSSSDACITKLKLRDVEGNETDGKSTESKENLNNKENQKATQNLSDTEFINPYQSIPQETQNTPKDNIGRNDERRKKKKAKKQNQTQSNMSDYVHVVKTSNTTSETVPKTPKSTNVKCLLNVFEKSPVTPPEELHQRENCSKKQKK